MKNWIAIRSSYVIRGHVCFHDSINILTSEGKKYHLYFAQYWEINFFSSTQKIYILQSRLHYLYSRVQNMDPSVDQVHHIDQVHQTIDQVHKPPFMDQVNGHPIFTTPYKQRCWYAWSLAHISMWLYLQFLSCQSWLTSIKVSTALFSIIPLSCLVGFFYLIGVWWFFLRYV